MRRWERARSGQGQFVQIVGEPGIGKSRLIEEFHARLGETPHTWVEWSSSQLLQNTPLHPIAEWGRQRFGDAETPAGQRLADLENTLMLIGIDPAEHAPLLAPLVDIPLPADRAAHLPPEELRRKQLAALAAWVLAGARSQPVALAFEDLHWADPTSLDLMAALAERGAQAPLNILATTRPEFRPPWSLRSHHSVMSLSPSIAPMSRRWSASSPRTVSAPARRSHAFCSSAANRAACRRSRPRSSSRSPRGSTGWAKRAKSRRSARCWDAISPTPSCALSPRSSMRLGPRRRRTRTGREPCRQHQGRGLFRLTIVRPAAERTGFPFGVEHCVVVRRGAHDAPVTQSPLRLRPIRGSSWCGARIDRASEMRGRVGS